MRKRAFGVVMIVAVVVMMLPVTATAQDGEDLVFFPAGSSNADWTPVIEEFDGVEMVLVPAGCLMMGSTEEQMAEYIQQCMTIDAPLLINEVKCGVYMGREGPVHEVCFDEPFWIDRYEVTNEQIERLGGVVTHAAGYQAEPEYPRDSIPWAEARVT